MVKPDAAKVKLRTIDKRTAGRRAKETRDRILESLGKLLTTMSYRDVRVTDVVKEVGTSPATFYQYFGNVEEAVRVLAEGVVDQAAQFSELAGGDWSPAHSWDKARTFTEGFPAYWEDNRAVFRVIDLASGRAIFTAAGSSPTPGRGTLSGATQELLGAMLAKLPFDSEPKKSQ